MSSSLGHASRSISRGRSSVRGALESYRRSQYFGASASIPSNSDNSDLEDDEERQSHRRRWSSSPKSDIEDALSFRLLPPDLPTEQTSLLPRDQSRSSAHRSYSALNPGIVPGEVPSNRRLSSDTSDPDFQVRRGSRSSVRSSESKVYVKVGGRSTFGQTLFNSIAMLLGLGMLSEPLAFAYAGWFLGTGLIFAYGFVACYTAKILARIILSDPKIRTYSDIGKKAFGPKATPLISCLFCLELFSVSVVLVTLFGDSLHSLLPQHTSNFYKACGILFLIPTVFLPLSLLSYTSLIGIISTLLLVLVIFIDGLSKPDAPGSLRSPARTDVGFRDGRELGVAFGLFMAGFSGHAVIPSLARDMVDPTQFDSMVNWAFAVATCIYTIIGYAGYLMFGRDVSDEVSVDLLATPGYNPALNTLCLWLLVLTPFSKFGLNTQPLNATLEILLDLSPSPASTSSHLSHPPSIHNLKPLLRVLLRVLLTTLSITTSILVPEFSAMMAFLGSFSAFLICVIGPVLAKVMIESGEGEVFKCGWFDGMVLAVGGGMAVWGTVAAFA